MHTPAHKSTTAAQTLSDYIKDVVESEKRLDKEILQKPRLTFDEWVFAHYGVFEDWDGNLDLDDLALAWEASRENM